MKRAVVLMLAVVCCIAVKAVLAEEGTPVRRELGFGVYVGDVAGLNFKFWISRRHALDFLLVWQGQERTYFHFDYIKHIYGKIQKGDISGEVPYYYGIGLRGDKIFAGGGNTSSGLRFVLGFNYLFKDMPADIFMEIAPTAMLEPQVTGILSVGMGARYYLD